MKPNEIFLCDMCGETSPQKFYEYRKGDRCKACRQVVLKVQQRKRITNIIKKCKVCAITGNINFYEFYTDICKVCQGKLSAIRRQQNKGAVLKCRWCGEQNHSKFHAKSRTRCKNCAARRYPYYEQLISTQNGEFCCICLRKPEDLDGRNLSVDHDHETGFVRGLLCWQCNLAIELFNKFPGGCERLSEYVKNPPALPLKIKYVGRSF